MKSWASNGLKRKIDFKFEAYILNCRNIICLCDGKNMDKCRKTNICIFLGPISNYKIVYDLHVYRNSVKVEVHITLYQVV